MTSDDDLWRSNVTFSVLVCCNLLCPQTFLGNEFGHPQQHLKPTPASLAESWDASEPERLERGGTFQPLLQLTFQVRLKDALPSHTHTHYALCQGSMYPGQKSSAKQFTHLSVLRFSVCKRAKKNVGHSFAHISCWTLCSSLSWDDLMFTVTRWHAPMTRSYTCCVAQWKNTSWTVVLFWIKEVRGLVIYPSTTKVLFTSGESHTFLHCVFLLLSVGRGTWRCLAESRTTTARILQVSMRSTRSLMAS